MVFGSALVHYSIAGRYASVPFSALKDTAWLSYEFKDVLLLADSGWSWLAECLSCAVVGNLFCA